MKLPPGHVAGQGVAKPKCTGGFGERMLRSMGWESGRGLGRQGQGIKEAIQVKKKEDTVGVGGNGSYAWADKWWEKAYESALQTVDDSDSSDSSDSDSDDEAIAAIAAAVNRDGTRTSASADELKLLASLSKGGKVAAGRFGGRDAKMARIRQQEAAMAAAAAAKLGVPSAAGTVSGGATTATGTTAAAAAGGSDASDTTGEAKLSGSSSKKRKSAAAEGAAGRASGASSGKAGKKARKDKGKSRGGAKEAAADAAPEEVLAGAAAADQPGAAAGGQPEKKQRIVIEPVVLNSGPQHQFVPTPATGWWGEKRFMSAGCLEGLDKAAAEAQRRRTTFDEDDQARIYNAAQAGKRQGKVGLGQGTGTVKVGGVKWEGKKVSFEEAEDEAGGVEEAGRGAAADGDGGRLAAIGSCTQLDVLEDGGKQARQKRGRAAAAEDAGDAGGQQQAAGGWEAAVKWKKLIVKQLQAAERQQLKVRELQRLVVAAVLDKHGSAVSSKAAVKAAFSSRLEGSSKWVVEGKVVRLCA